MMPLKFWKQSISAFLRNASFHIYGVKLYSEESNGSGWAFNLGGFYRSLNLVTELQHGIEVVLTDGRCWWPCS